MAKKSITPGTVLHMDSDRQFLPGPVSTAEASSTVEDPGLAAVCASAPTIAGVPTVAPGIIAAGRKQSSKKKFRFQVRNDFAGSFGGELEGNSKQEIEEYVKKRLTAGIQVFEVV